VAPGRKQDPGAGFDWPALRRALGMSAANFPLNTTRD
jgi:AmpD protein